MATPRYLSAMAVSVAASLLSASAWARDPRAVSLPAQPLANSLQAIAQRFGVELVFSHDLVTNRRAPAVTGRLEAQAAFGLALAGSGLTVRQTPDGAYVINAPIAAEEAASVAIAEILVIGRRTQNADIRRTEDDVRPYQVVSDRQIATSHIATIEELAAKRLTANAQGAMLLQTPTSSQGETASSINLRGLGTGQTLVLIDGRRLPRMPDRAASFIQSDVNALPPEAIERVEAITSTAGGIYGPGATAGVVNLILKRDYRGVDLAVTGGLTARGDAPYNRVNLRLGFTPDHGATDVMVALSRSDFGGLDVGDRDYGRRSSALQLANNPSWFLARGIPPSRSLNVLSRDRTPLVFKPAYGGGALNATYTFAPPADGRSATALQQQLAANAGSLDLQPSDNAASGGASLLSDRRTSSIIANLRHRAGSTELFLDYLDLSNRGHAVTTNGLHDIPLAANNPNNPFLQAIDVFVSDPAQAFDFDFRTHLSRLEAGVITDLPSGWRGEADVSAGSARRDSVETGTDLTLAGLTAYYGQLYGSGVSFNPLDDYSSFVAAYGHGLGPFGMSFHQVSKYLDASARAAGPIMMLDGGPMTATVQAEVRRERVAGGTTDGFSPLIGSVGTQSLPHYTETTGSLYGEIRAPLINAQSQIWWGRGLELQLAARHDITKTQAPLDVFAADADADGLDRTVRQAGTVYTLGLKAFPLHSVLVRGSLSTGQLPLSVEQISRRVLTGVGFSSLPDAKRGGTTALRLFDEIVGGPLDASPERGRSASIGLVFQPTATPGLRLSLDYTRIVKRHELVDTYLGNADYFLTHEAAYPGRVTRAPLTPDDTARGYTGGLIVQVDTSDLQIGETTIDSLDAQFDLKWPTARWGDFDLHGAATWQPRFRRSVGPGLPRLDLENRPDGALTIRGNAGVLWSLGPLGLSLDTQMTGGYRITSANRVNAYSNANDLLSQGGDHIPSQATVDLGVEYRFALPGAGGLGRPRTAALRFGVQDLFDARAATVVNTYGGYSVYEDPRRRRFEMTVAIAL